jgi:putative protein kinase ArgK-like GTPase of G3E family
MSGSGFRLLKSPLLLDRDHALPKSLELSLPSGLASVASEPMVVGVYGVSGAGKSHLLRHLRRIVDDDYIFF